jgi:hypothetical protein
MQQEHSFCLYQTKQPSPVPTSSPQHEETNVLKNGRDSERERGGDWEAWSVLRAKMSGKEA